jgi:hypothetical protein
LAKCASECNDGLGAAGPETRAGGREMILAGLAILLALLLALLLDI